MHNKKIEAIVMHDWFVQSEQHTTELKASLTDPETYWANVAENTVWEKKWDKVQQRDVL